MILFLFSTSIGRAEDDLLDALPHPGVISGSLTIFKGWAEPKRPSWIDRRVEEKIRNQTSPSQLRRHTDCEKRKSAAQPTVSFTITGGTGRFADASGSGTIQTTLVITSPTTSTFTATITGTISY